MVGYKSPELEVSILTCPTCNFRTFTKETAYTRTQLRGLFTNDRSLADKMGKLKMLLYEDDLDFVGISGTWFSSSHDWLATIPGYSLYCRDWVGKKGGEVCLYIKNYGLYK